MGFLRSRISVKRDCKCSNPTDAVEIVRKYDCSELKRCEVCFGDRESTNNDHYTYTAFLSLTGCRDPARINIGVLKCISQGPQITTSHICQHLAAPESLNGPAAGRLQAERASQVSRRCLCYSLCLPACHSVETA